VGWLAAPFDRTKVLPRNDEREVAQQRAVRTSKPPVRKGGVLRCVLLGWTGAKTAEGKGVGGRVLDGREQRWKHWLLLIALLVGDDGAVRRVLCSEGTGGMDHGPWTVDLETWASLRPWDCAFSCASVMQRWVPALVRVLNVGQIAEASNYRMPY
jgi:hypothetical protein